MNSKIFLSKQKFKAPKKSRCGMPFWSWNGDLKKEELFRQIDVMKEMGFGGYFMHSRTGLVTEYLGEEWFELINACADYGEKIGMESWLYDEDRWPSGLAGGKVTQHPEFRQKAIFLEIDPAGPGENVIAEFTCDLDGVVYTHVEQAGESASRTLLRFSVVEQGRSNFYNGCTYVDTMSRAATQAFLDSTHEKYAEQCGDRLGRNIRGIFTDEPHRGALMDGFCIFREQGDHHAPYTPGLFEEFQTRFGYDLKEKLPELFLQQDGKRVSQVKWHYVELLQQLFLENFAIPCKQWCDEHNMVLTGHVLHEDNLTAQTAMSGSMMRYYEHMTSPGVDVLTEGNNSYWIVKQLSSAARQLGQTQLLSELYGCTGWQMPFKGHKAVGDWQALLGINLRCHHLSWYTMTGEAKRDYPSSILHQSAWYKQYAYVEDYFTRFAMVMSEGDPVCDVLVLNPVESVWAQVYAGWSHSLALQDDQVGKLEEKYRNIFTWLLGSQIDFDYGDEEMISRLYSVEKAEDGVFLRIGQAKYKTVVAGGMVTIRSTTLEILKEFQAAGGDVVFVGDPPDHVDALPEKVTGFKTVPFERDALLSAVPTSLARVDAPDILGQIRRSGDTLIFAALNVNRTEAHPNARVRIHATGTVEEWDCLTGEQFRIAAEEKNGVLEFAADFPAGGEKIYMVSPQSEAQLKPEFDVVKTDAVDGPFEYELSEPNVGVLDFAEHKIDEGEWQPAQEVLKVDQAVRDRFGLPHRGGQMLQPWFVAQQPIEKKGTVALRYSFVIETLPKGIDLAFEKPDGFSIEVNGTLLDTSSASGRWIDIAFHRVALPVKMLRTGQNEIVLTMEYTENGNIEAVYLLGEFGVELNGLERRIVPLPEKLACGDICGQSLPFYSGSIRYTLPVPEKTADALQLHLPEFGGACAVVHFDGDESLIAWDPYLADVSAAETELVAEVVLTRRNTFGPLHDTLDPRSSVGPVNFTTTGDEFSEACRLLPNGLLQPPEFRHCSVS